MNRSRCGNRGFDECRGRGSAASSRHPRAPAARPGPSKIVAAEPAGDVDAAPAPRTTTSKCSIALLKGPVIRRERLPAHSPAKPLDRRLASRSPCPIAASRDRPPRSRRRFKGRRALLRVGAVVPGKDCGGAAASDCGERRSPNIRCRVLTRTAHRGKLPKHQFEF